MARKTPKSDSFARRLSDRQTDPSGRRWLFVPYDQLSDGIGPLSREDPGDLGIILIECPWKASRRPYHRQKLALVLANLRHFALEQAGRGVAVRHVVSGGPYRDGLERAIDAIGPDGPVRVMRPAEYELRSDLEPLVEAGRVDVVPHDGWLTTREWFEESQGDDPPWRMDAFYRHVRQQTGLLMNEDGKPEGGKFSHDAANREPWSGEPPAPDPPRFPDDEVTSEVADLIDEQFSTHPGEIRIDALPSTADDAQSLWRWAKKHCLEHFGPYEDAMSRRSTGLFHTRISPLLNLHRLLPGRVVADVGKAKAPVASREGFVRQVLGWREFIRHVHEATDGFRSLPGGRPSVLRKVRDGGWGRWSGNDWSAPEPDGSDGMDGGAAPSFLDSDGEVPPAFWGERSGLACLDQVVADVWREGWSHHITRLMVLSNLATLLDVSPRHLADWFWAAYIDAFDWVVEPNVIGMGTFGLGDLFTTKPYVSGAAYINRMSDYCGECAFDPKSDCPVTPLYWAFLARHSGRLKDNNRLRMPMASLKKRAASKRRRDRAVFEHVTRRLSRGRPVAPDDIPEEGRK